MLESLEAPGLTSARESYAPSILDTFAGQTSIVPLKTSVGPDGRRSNRRREKERGIYRYKLSESSRPSAHRRIIGLAAPLRLARCPLHPCSFHRVSSPSLTTLVPPLGVIHGCTTRSGEEEKARTLRGRGRSSAIVACRRTARLSREHETTGGGHTAHRARTTTLDSTTRCTHGTTY